VRRFFFDTNVLVYLSDNRDPEKKVRAQRVFAEESEREALSSSVRRSCRSSTGP
jgi:predicted nucleic acid-binding protein